MMQCPACHIFQACDYEDPSSLIRCHQCRRAIPGNLWLDRRGHSLADSQNLPFDQERKSLRLRIEPPGFSPKS
jgi:hypothetical protein